MKLHGHKQIGTWGYSYMALNQVYHHGNFQKRVFFSMFDLNFVILTVFDTRISGKVENNRFPTLGVCAGPHITHITQAGTLSTSFPSTRWHPCLSCLRCFFLNESPRFPPCKTICCLCANSKNYPPPQRPKNLASFALGCKVTYNPPKVNIFIFCKVHQN